MGAGFWGQVDLVGEVNQWALDGYATNFPTAYASTTCVDCFAPTSAESPAFRMIRGGSFASSQASALGTTVRADAPSMNRASNIGFRCARTP